MIGGCIALWLVSGRELHCSVADRELHCSVAGRELHCSVAGRELHCSVADRELHYSVAGKELHCSVASRELHCSVASRELHCSGEYHQACYSPGSTYLPHCGRSHPPGGGASLTQTDQHHLPGLEDLCPDSLLRSC